MDPDPDPIIFQRILHHYEIDILPFTTVCIKTTQRNVDVKNTHYHLIAEEKMIRLEFPQQALLTDLHLCIHLYSVHPAAVSPQTFKPEPV